MTTFGQLLDAAAARNGVDLAAVRDRLNRSEYYKTAKAQHTGKASDRVTSALLDAAMQRLDDHAATR